jgi:hypothetical protein
VLVQVLLKVLKDHLLVLEVLLVALLVLVVVLEQDHLQDVELPLAVMLEDWLDELVLMVLKELLFLDHLLVLVLLVLLVLLVKVLDLVLVLQYHVK